MGYGKNYILCMHYFQDELRTDTRKKNLLILVLNYMHEEGYVKGWQFKKKEQFTWT